MAKQGYDAGVKEYRDMYWTPDYVPLDTDLLACFKCTGQPEVPREEVAAAVAAESSTGTWSTVWSELLTDMEYYKGRCYRIEDVPGDSESFYAFIAYPIDLFEEGSVVNVLTSLVGNVFGFKALRHLRLEDIRFPIAYIKTCGGPPAGIQLERDRLGKYGRPLLGATIKPKLGLRPEPFAEAAYQFWLGGDFIKNDEPQGNQVFAPLKETIALVAEAMDRAQQDTGEAKLFSANITADDYREMIARGDFILETFAENADHVAFLVDGYVAGPTAITTARRQFPSQYLHYHRAGHGAVTSPQTQRGYTAFVLAKMARLQGASGIHVGTMSYGKMEGEKGDTDIAYMIERDSADGPFYHQEWQGMRPTTPIISGGMNALRLPGFFDNLGHSNLILTAGGGSYGHVDGPAAGATSLRQAEQCWREGADPLEFARDHQEFARAFESFPADADRIFPNWRNVLDDAA